MPFESFFSALSPQTLTTLAIDLGLFILLVWFVILLLILREFRKFARSFVDHNRDHQHTLDMCQQSVEKALDETREQGETLNELVEIQQALEVQVSQINKLDTGQMGEEERTSIDELHQKLNQSQRLVRKLKDDLGKTTQGLKRAMAKLLEQNDTMAALKKEKNEVETQFDQLEKEYVQISKSGGFSEIEQDLLREKEALQAIIDGYKQKLAQQGNGGGNAQQQAIAKTLKETQVQLKNITKEKDFIEKKFLELVQETQQKSS